MSKTRWNLVVSHNNEYEIFKRYGDTEDEAKQVLETQLNEMYGYGSFHIEKVDKDKTKPVKE